MNNKAVYFPGPNRVELRDEPLPELKEGELLIENTRTLISTGTESIVLTQNFSPDNESWGNWARYPFRPGYLSVGRVQEIGPGVSGWKKGDRVAARRTHASYVISKASQSLPIPDPVSDDEATWMGLGQIVQVGVRAAEHKLGDTVAVVGLGLLGQLVCQYARIMGASRIIAIDTAPRRLEFAKLSGATHVLKMTAAEALDAVKEITKGARADVVYDVTGNYRVLTTALPLARNFGRVILLGTPGSPEKQTLADDVVKRGLHLVGAHASHPPESSDNPAVWSIHRMHELFLHYLSTRQMDVRPLITHYFEPDQAPKAYDLLQKEREAMMGAIFKWK